MALLSWRWVTVGAAALVLTACGTSVADADRVRPSPTPRPAPLTPFCEAARGQTDALRPLSALAQRGSVPADQLTAAVDAVRRSNADLVATAPNDLLPDVQRYVDSLNRQLDAVAQVAGKPQAAVRDPGVVAATAAPDAVAAAQRVVTYIAKNCPGYG